MDRQLPIEKKAYYNLLWMTQGALATQEPQSWEIEDQRQISLADLFARLKAFGLDWDEAGFLKASQDFESPEKMTVGVIPLLNTESNKTDDKVFDQLYLLIFELWRRLLPEKVTLSIFCDELDHLIVAYDLGLIEDLLPIDQAISTLCRLLEAEAEVLNEPLEAFEHISRFLANDLEGFLFDWLNELVGQEYFEQASQKLGLLLPFVSDPKWFLLLKARLDLHTNREQATQDIRALLDETDAEPDLDFVFEMLSLAGELEDKGLFLQATRQALHLIRYEADFRELIALAIDLFETLQNPSIIVELESLEEERREIDLADPLSEQDPALLKFYQTVERG
jgi:hypothetical protein